MIVTCVADVLPTCTVAGSPDQKQKYNFERRYLLLSLRHYCYYSMISVHRQLIIVDSHFHFTQHSCFRPGPPNFGLLTQKGQSPQPSSKHPSHPLHFDVFSPISSNNCLQCVHVTFLISCKPYWFHWLLCICR